MVLNAKARFLSNYSGREFNRRQSTIAKITIPENLYLWFPLDIRGEHATR